MITKAGRLRSTISQGSARRLARRERPMARPIAEPSPIAITKAAATRARVVARLSASAPERASSSSASATACGPGRRRSPAKWESGRPGCDQQAERDQPPAQSCLLRGGAIEGTGRQRARSTNELCPADIGEDQIQGTRVRLLLGERTPEDTFAVALAVDRARTCATRAEFRREPLPFRFGPGQDFFCLMYCREKSLDSGGIAAGPIAVEGVTDDRDRSLRPEATYDVFHRNRTAEPSVLELGAKIP